MTAARKKLVPEQAIVTHLHVAVIGETTRTRHKLHVRQAPGAFTAEQLAALPPAQSLQDGPWCVIEHATGIHQYIAIKRLRGGLVLDVVCVQAEPRPG